MEALWLLASAVELPTALDDLEATLEATTSTSRRYAANLAGVIVDTPKQLRDVSAALITQAVLSNPAESVLLLGPQGLPELKQIESFLSDIDREPVRVGPVILGSYLQALKVRVRDALPTRPTRLLPSVRVRAATEDLLKQVKELTAIRVEGFLAVQTGGAVRWSDGTENYRVAELCAPGRLLRRIRAQSEDGRLRLGAGQIDAIVEVATRNSLLDRLGVLRAVVPEARRAGIKRSDRKSDQIYNDLHALNELPACPEPDGTIEHPISLWLRRAVQMVSPISSEDAHFLEQVDLQFYGDFR